MKGNSRVDGRSSTRTRWARRARITIATAALLGVGTFGAMAVLPKDEQSVPTDPRPPGLGAARMLH